MRAHMLHPLASRAAAAPLTGKKNLEMFTRRTAAALRILLAGNQGT